MNNRPGFFLGEMFSSDDDHLGYSRIVEEAMTTPVKGYPEISDEQLALVNETKVLEERILRHIECFDEKLPEGPDEKWVHIGKVAIVQGFMALNRAIMKPQRITLPEDP